VTQPHKLLRKFLRFFDSKKEAYDLVAVIAPDELIYYLRLPTMDIPHYLNELTGLSIKTDMPVNYRNWLPRLREMSVNKHRF
jgi:hypothetical protein